MFNPMMDPWSNFPGKSSWFGLQQTMKSLDYHDPEKARRVVRQAYVRGKELSDLSPRERFFLEMNFRRDKDDDFRLYRDCLFIFSNDGSLITVYPVRFPSDHFVGKKKLNYKEYKAYRKTLDYEMDPN